MSVQIDSGGGWHLDVDFESCDELLAQPEVKADVSSYTAEDFELCSGFLHKGSSSFHAASKLLPDDVRRGTVMLYSYCRLADDLVDELGDPARALGILHRRLDRVYRDVPCDHPVDRGLLCAAKTWGIPKAVFEALLEGFQWDSGERHYETIEELIEYCVRVASTVGVMMTLVMGESSVPTLARACDLGVAFQLTNIARDVGEDARNGRVYLPEAWLRDEGLSSKALIAEPQVSEPLRRVIDRILRVADQIYVDAEVGVRMLPHSCQPAVQAAHLIYRSIGGILRDELDLDSISSRARSNGRQKVQWAVVALVQTRLIWPLRRRFFGDPAVEAARLRADAFKEYAPLLNPFVEPASSRQQQQQPKAGKQSASRSPSRSPSPKKAKSEPELGWFPKKVRYDANGWPLLGEGSWRTSNLAAPRDETARMSKLQYLKQAREYGDLKGLTAALTIMAAWVLMIHRGLTMTIVLPETAAAAPLWASALLGHVLVMTFLYTGMFITAHDAMHGVVAPHYRRLNDVIGAVCVRCFALFDYSLLLGAHWEHHRHPATANDPDFHVPGTEFWPWYIHFMQEYASLKQLAGMGLAYNVSKQPPPHLVSLCHYRCLQSALHVLPVCEDLCDKPFLPHLDQLHLDPNRCWLLAAGCWLGMATGHGVWSWRAPCQPHAVLGRTCPPLLSAAVLLRYVPMLQPLLHAFPLCLFLARAHSDTI
jgi:phytoene synthase